MTAPQPILDLIERFEHNLEAYHSGQYKESQFPAATNLEEERMESGRVCCWMF